MSPSPRRPATRRPIARAALALVLGAGLLASARAQSLVDLYEAAHAYDANYLAARANLDAAQSRYDQARGLRLPQVGLVASAGRQVNGTPDAPSQTNLAGNSASIGVNGSQTLFNRQNDLTIRQAERQIDLYRADVDAAEQDLILRLSQAYFDVLAAQDNVATARASQDAITESVASARRNFEVGTATITDTREAQARSDLARSTQIQAENDLTTRRILLDQTVGRANLVPKPLALPIVLPPAPTNVEEWVQRADAEHPTIRRARVARELARLDTDKARAQKLPVVALTAGYSRGRSDVNVYGPGYSQDYRTPNNVGQIGIQLNMPLFAGFQIENRIRETIALEDKTQNDVEAARRGVALTTRQLYYLVGSSAAQVDALRAAESSSQLALEATQLGFKVGVRVNIDVLNAQAQLYNTQAQLAKARYDLIMAGLRLRQASGRVTGEDVAAVNALLVR